MTPRCHTAHDGSGGVLLWLEHLLGTLAALSSLGAGIYSGFVPAIAARTCRSMPGAKCVSSGIPWSQDPGTAIAGLVVGAMAAAAIFSLVRWDAHSSETEPLLVLWVAALSAGAAAVVGILSLLLAAPVACTLLTAATSTLRHIAARPRPVSP